MSDIKTSPIAAQFPNAIEVILANGWSDRERLERSRLVAMTGPEPLPTAGRSRIAQFFLDQTLLTREQAQDLDTVLRIQANLPGFRLLKKIGSGGMGIVFLAIHLASGRRCALKTLNMRLASEEDFVNRFHREAKSLVGITHPSIAEVIESGECDGHCYLAMEYIEGPSAMSMLKDYRALPEAYSLRIIKQIAEGLAHVYAVSHLVHRDIKPENILIVRSTSTTGELFGNEDQAKLIDFGLVKSLGEDDQRLTQTGMTIGTPLYMSPEQVRGDALDCRSDIYGLGATLYHLLTGATPFLGNSPGIIMSAHLTEQVPDPGARVPSLSAETKQIVMTSMAKNADDRFLTHEALIAACTTALALVSGKAEGSPKLLRKPMVLKNTRKPETSRVAVASGGHLARQPGNAQEISSRIISKHRQMQSGEKPDTAATRVLQRTGSPPVQEGQTPTALERINPAHLPPLPQPLRPDSALVAEAKAAGQTGRIGLMPILALIAAVMALVGYIVFFRP